MDPLREGHERGAALRTFFAVALAPAARAAAARAAERLRRSLGDVRVRWVRPENLHVTLRFLGAVPADRIDPLVARVGAEVAREAPFALRLGAVCAFPSPRRPRVLALAVEPEPTLAGVAAAVERGVVAAGLPPETRPFRAHLTLGRLAPRSRRPDPAALDVTAADTPEAETSPVTEVVLMHSQTRPSGPRYTPLARLPLGPPERAGPTGP